MCPTYKHNIIELQILKSVEYLSKDLYSYKTLES